MPKSILIIVLACMIGSAHAHCIHPVMKSKIAYTETVDCGSVSLTDIFRRARLWASQSAPDNKTLVDDKETGDFVTQGNITITIPRSENSAGGIFKFAYVLSVECANRKYRATVANVEYQDGNGGHTIPMEAFSQKSENKAAATELENKLKEMLADLQTNVKDYKPF
ncbi:DUF4468 domain-containing protein [Dyadobacter sp. CY261]|uniref:DUF4468 domain-containing protein n=1 Tax=Dyadobacter sp. CY261 TaxID=2907203 RepID=UPI001F223A1B|nr:DUF4468 domain-containing protein [Dyadobacter sp. CY261]MCF0070228.1 DUF4468 domain-containing protein [Dyadobacter sp. CY261]